MMSYYEDLPNDILIHIFGFFSKKQLLTNKLINKKSYTAAKRALEIQTPNKEPFKLYCVGMPFVPSFLSFDIRAYKPCQALPVEFRQEIISSFENQEAIKVFNKLQFAIDYSTYLECIHDHRFNTKLGVCTPLIAIFEVSSNELNYRNFNKFEKTYFYKNKTISINIDYMLSKPSELSLVDSQIGLIAKPEKKSYYTLSIWMTHKEKALRQSKSENEEEKIKIATYTLSQ